MFLFSCEPATSVLISCWSQIQLLVTVINMRSSDFDLSLTDTERDKRGCHHANSPIPIKFEEVVWLSTLFTSDAAQLLGVGWVIMAAPLEASSPTPDWISIINERGSKRRRKKDEEEEDSCFKPLAVISLQHSCTRNWSWKKVGGSEERE